MANTKNTKNKSGKSNSTGKSTRKKKNSSDDTIKFLLVLVIAAIAIALIFFSQSKEKEAGNPVAGTLTPTVTAGQTVSPGNTETQTPAAAPTTAPATGQGTPDSTPEPTEEPLATATPEPTATPVPTVTPTPALSATEAKKVVTQKVDTSVYDVQLVSENLIVGKGSYYQFGAIKNHEIVAPFLVVNKADGSLHFYDSTEDTVFDFTKFPLKTESTPTPTPTAVPESADTLTAKEAYEVLCTYSKEALHIAKEVKEYDEEYGDELTWIDGVDCYRINLSEFSNGKVRNRGEFYISVDGKKCYYIDNDTNEFVEAVK